MAVVFGVSVAVPVPPVAVVYHSSVLPADAVAVSGVALVAPSQYATGVEDTVGAAGVGVIVTVSAARGADSQPFSVCVT